MKRGAELADVSPEDMFLAWFLRLPHACDVAAAARHELARLDGMPLSEATRRLRGLLEQATLSPSQATQSRRRVRH